MRLSRVKARTKRCVCQNLVLFVSNRFRLVSSFNLGDLLKPLFLSGPPPQVSIVVAAFKFIDEFDIKLDRMSIIEDISLHS